jgi:hypothetical protein
METPNPTPELKPKRKKSMKLVNDGLRSMPKLDYSLGIRTMTKSPLILIKATGEVSYGNSRGEKDGIEAAYSETRGDLLLFAWAGEWKTDVFSLKRADLTKHY